MSSERPHNPIKPQNSLVKGGLHPLERALTSEELDAQMERDIEAAAARVAAAKAACALKHEKRKLKNGL